MPEFKVVWEMDIEADTPRAAAERALEIHRDPQSIATEFTVDGQQIDLGEWASEGYRVPSSPPDAPLDEIDYQPPGAGEIRRR